MKLAGASNETQEHAIEYSGLIVVPTAIVFLAITGLGSLSDSGRSSRSYSRPPYNSTTDVDKLYRSQFASEEERLEFEAWDADQQELRELYRDAPTGQTRGGDSF